MPVDYKTEKHRGFAFVEFELPEDAKAAIDNMVITDGWLVKLEQLLHPNFAQNDSELFGRTLKVNQAKPLRLKENSTRPVWADDEWLQKYSGQASKENEGDNQSNEVGQTGDSEDKKRTAESTAEVKRRALFIFLYHIQLLLTGERSSSK